MIGAIVVMGVSGSRKSTLGAALARSLKCAFLEGDAFHSAAAVEKMRTGHPLEDDDRWPWLDRRGDALAETIDRHGVGVAFCSALRRRYSERLALRVVGDIRYNLLDGHPVMMARRLQERRYHLMPATLLESRIATLDPPSLGGQAITLPADQSNWALCCAIIGWLGFETEG